MPEGTLLVSALLLGLSGSGHCLGMCGGLTAALQLAGNGSIYSILAFHSARIFSYASLGMLAGFITSTLDIHWLPLFLRYLAGFFLIAMGLYVGGWWRGLAVIEKAGAVAFRPLQQRLTGLNVRSPVPASALLGLCWFAMPCGLIYSALAVSATTLQPIPAAVFMLAFGVGTLPSMLAVSLGADKLMHFLRQRNLKNLIACALIVAGCWTIYAAASHAGHGHGPAEQHEHLKHGNHKQ